MGKLVVFEGIDGVGKSTLSKMLAEALISCGIPALRYEDVEEPGAGFNALKPFVKQNVSIEASFFFYLASAIHKSTNIERLLKSRWVICDRYIYSTVAHHIVNGLERRLVPNLDMVPIRKPDYFFLVVTEESLRITRMARRPNSSRDDFVANTRGSIPRLKEEIFRSFDPVVIDNSAGGPEVLIRTLLSSFGFKTYRPVV